ncbi:MAG: hypothetical protein LBB80_02150 [Treponema sp.]|jgi:hypothetical protein|nr:hypothetical protein [Treponema sp.]
MVAFRLSGGNVPDAVEGRLLPETIEKRDYTVNLWRDRAYEDERTGLRVGALRFNPVVPLKRNRVHLWEYDMELYKRRNELERLFLGLKEGVSRDLYPL